ncbi:MAG: hypothetical protein GYA24_05050 [Candidatus Lokiarchaeota archaeon]|nr:hypothetical protein [Candidatus Lokiarchaeota archaeon]
MTLFYITIGLLAAKASLIIFLISRIFAERRNAEKTPLGLLYAGAFCMSMFLLSRLGYMTFDFFMTRFDPSTYTIPPAIHVWTAANLVNALGSISLLIVVERSFLLWRLKGILVIFVSAIVIINAIYPIRQGTLDDFNMVSTLGLVGGSASLSIPIIFFILGRTAPALRKFAWIFSFGVLVFAVGSGGLSQSIIDTVLRDIDRDLVFFTGNTLKVVGISILAYGMSKIREINKAMIEYFQAKRICIVHRGKIDGQVFMCATCRVFYCIPCKVAIVELENTCWNCKSILVPRRPGPDSSILAMSGGERAESTMGDHEAGHNKREEGGKIMKAKIETIPEKSALDPDTRR